MVLIRFTGLGIFDSIVGILVSLVILKAGYEVLRKSFGELVDNRLPEEEESAIISCIEEHTTSLAGYHKVRTRKSGSQRFIDYHLLCQRT
jgi:divalent metal cation (Fe/Co/Zn/Cd) transporter